MKLSGAPFAERLFLSWFLLRGSSRVVRWSTDNLSMVAASGSGHAHSGDQPACRVSGLSDGRANLAAVTSW